MNKNRKGWIQTLSGNAFEIFNPQPSMFRINEIAHALALQNRFNGHTKFPYSVAQHSVNVSKLLREWGLPTKTVFAGLMHDAAETYVGDLVSPIKREIPEFQVIEERIVKALSERFGFTYPMPWSVGKADMALLMTERRDLLAASPREWFEGEGLIPLPEWSIEELGWRKAKDLFILEFFTILDELDGESNPGFSQGSGECTH